ncbi:hypothetical protein [Marinobacter sp. SS8-8]|nr:hypothetical protein [Marinobacter sp. SS8-8]|tara:strand:- start:30289 stop:30414 length:126 start_codon:yes stop_codon:yes gene_type:complete
MIRRVRLVGWVALALLVVAGKQAIKKRRIASIQVNGKWVKK